MDKNYHDDTISHKDGMKMAGLDFARSIEAADAVLSSGKGRETSC